MRVRNNSTDTKIEITVATLRYGFTPGFIHSYPNKWYNEVEVEVDLYDDLEILLDAEGGGPADEVGITILFDIPTWIQSGEYYYVDLAHGFGKNKLQVEIFRDVSPDPIRVSVHKKELIDNNTIRIYSTFDPDTRFKGWATLIKMAN